MYTTLHKTVSWFQGIHKHTHTYANKEHGNPKSCFSPFYKYLGREAA